MVCVALAAGLGLTALLSYRAAVRAAEDVLYTRASEAAASFLSTARMTEAMSDDSRLAALAKEMASDQVGIAVIDLDGHVVVASGDDARVGATLALGLEQRRELRLQGQAHGMVGDRIEYWRPMRGPGWGRWGKQAMRRWWRWGEEKRDVESKNRPFPDVPRGKLPDRASGGSGGPRLMRVTVPQAAAATLLGPARLNVTLAGIVAAALLALGVVMHRAARRAQRAEAELHRRRALAALGEMAAVLAHEIRTPLGSIKGNAQLIGEERAGDDRVQSIVDEAGRLERLVNGLLDYARPTAPRRVACDPDALLERAVQIVAPRAVGASVAIVTDPARCGACLRADPDQILQVLVNLLQNGVEACATPAAHGATVSIAVRRGGGQVVFTVQDAGPGLQGSDPDQIFRPFFSTKHQGTGLGLSVARQIVEQHGGTLELRERAEGGVIATVTLPEGGA